MPADMQQNSILVHLYPVFLFSFNNFIFMFSSFNNFIQLLFLHSEISVLYSINGCLCNNDIFIQQYVSDSIIINSSYNLDFPSVLCFLTNFNNFIQKFHAHSKILVSFKNVIFIQKLSFIQKLYIHSVTFSLYIQVRKDSHVIA